MDFNNQPPMTLIICQDPIIYIDKYLKEVYYNKYDLDNTIKKYELSLTVLGSFRWLKPF